MVFRYYRRLTRAQQRVYQRSDEITSLALPDAAGLRPQMLELAEGLGREDRARTAAAAQALASGLVTRLALPSVRVQVQERRPSHDWGELHGLYEPSENRSPAKMTLWMRTAKRRQVVAFRTFLRTLVHELGHHVDYELLGLAETFHTEGFYKRESNLLHQLLRQIPAVSGPGQTSGRRAAPG